MLVGMKVHTIQHALSCPRMPGTCWSESACLWRLRHCEPLVLYATCPTISLWSCDNGCLAVSCTAFVFVPAAQLAMIVTLTVTSIASDFCTQQGLHACYE